MQTKILDSDKRIFEAWGSVEIKDKDGELIPIEELEKVMPILMDRGGYIIDQHTNRVVGKILNYEIKEHPETGKKGVYIRGKIFNDYELDDQVWEEIKSGKRTGLSFGGRSKKQEIAFSFENKEPVKVLREIEGYEFSVVDKPANPLATFEWINPIAKQYKEPERMRDMIAEAVYGKKFDELTDEQKQKVCNIAQKIKEVGKALEEVQKPFAGFKDFDDCIRHMKEEQGYDEETARKVCGKIYWQTEGKNKKKEYIEKTYAHFFKDNNDRPPQSWWARCIEKTSSFTDEPANFCKFLWEDQLLKNTEEVNAMVDKKVEKQDEAPAEEQNNLEARVAALEKKIQELEQKLAPVEELTEGEEAQKEGDVGTKPINPDPKGGKVTLPKAVSEKVQEEEPKPETDEVKITEKMENLEKKIEEITKGLSKIGVVSTPRVEEVSKEEESEEKVENPAWEIIQKARKGEKVTMLDIKEMVAKQKKKELEKILKR